MSEERQTYLATSERVADEGKNSAAGVGVGSLIPNRFCCGLAPRLSDPLMVQLCRSVLVVLQFVNREKLKYSTDPRSQPKRELEEGGAYPGGSFPSVMI